MNCLIVAIFYQITGMTQETWLLIAHCSIQLLFTLWKIFYDKSIINVFISLIQQSNLLTFLIGNNLFLIATVQKMPAIV